jgi:WD40 repeat protein
MYSQPSQQSQRHGQSPPLPHHPQQHFYGAPDPLLGITSRASGLKPGTQGYYCGFDGFGASALGSKHVDSVIVCGYEGGLGVYAVLRSGLEKITGLEDLRGGVYNAKILPWTTQGETRHDFPLIAIVLDGPAFQSTDAPSGDYCVQATSEAQPASKNETIRSSPRAIPVPTPSNLSITHYQTSVEVYSLSNKRHVGTLLSLPKVPLVTPITSPHFKRPSPIGALSISADAGNIVLTSGTTGEVWIYHQVELEGDKRLGFWCIGKIWTTIQRTPMSDPNGQSEFSDGNGLFSEPRTMKQQPSPALISLKGRWLAYTPPAATSQVSLRATIPAQVSSTRAPGIHTYAPPQAPQANCVVDIPEGEQLFKRLKREATQVLLKGAKWAGDQGVQAWNSYWHKPIGKPQTGGIGSSGQFTPLPNPIQQDLAHGFPPTHGEALQQTVSNTEPTLISILDIERVATLRYTSPAVSPQPLATFKAPLGCSFMSFAPNGLALLTVSTNGDIQFVWDLMRIQHAKSSALQTPHIGSPQSPHVRQIAVFTRVTPARIVDVVWTMPQGERIAMITKNNTVHFWDMPASAFTWPPSRRRAKAPLPRNQATSDIADTPASAATIATNAVTAAWSLAQPLIMRPRGLSGSGRTGISAASVTAQASQGGRALASGISKSFGAATETIGEFYKSVETKVHLSSTKTPSMGCIKWLNSLHRDSLAALVEGGFRTEVKIYTVMEKKTRGKTSKQQIHVGRGTIKYELPLLPDYDIAPAIMRAIDFEDLDLSERDIEAIQWDYHRTAVAKQDLSSGTESSIPQAEIESNAPYQPFHTDRRVNLHVYLSASAQPLSPSVSALLTPLNTTTENSPSTAIDSPWVFGRPISTMKLNVGPPHADKDDIDPSEHHRALPSSAIERVTTKTAEPDEYGEQIVITTRRRKGTVRSIKASVDDDGFFEDDCEVLDFASQRV